MRTPKLFQTIFGKGDKQTTTARFTVQGMSCAGCVARVEKAIRQLPGIASVSVDLAAGTATVSHEASKVTHEQIRNAIAAIGFGATTVSAG